VTAESVSKTYGQTAALGGFSQTGLMNGETIGSVTEASAGKVATAGVAGSPYVITASNATGGTFTPGNYTISYVNGALTVIPAGLTVTANNVTKTYGQTPALNGFTETGLANGETIGSVTEASAGKVATAGVAGSPYVITASNATGGTFTPGNYTISYVNGALTVIPAALTVTANSITKIYGETPPLNGFTEVGLVNSETIGHVTETSPGQNPSAYLSGSPYVIHVSDATGGTFTPGNYSITYVSGVLTVVPGVPIPPFVPPFHPPVIPAPVPPMTWIPVVVPNPQPELLTVAVAPPPAAPVVYVAPPVEVAPPPPAAPEPVYVPPVYPPKQDRH
jgi:hypothetical protein